MSTILEETIEPPLMDDKALASALLFFGEMFRQFALGKAPAPPIRLDDAPPVFIEALNRAIELLESRDRAAAEGRSAKVVRFPTTPQLTGELPDGDT